MKNAQEVLRMKEAELQRVRREIEALRITARLLEEDGQHSTHDSGLKARVAELP
jgi:hypothetical protein